MTTTTSPTTAAATAKATATTAAVSATTAATATAAATAAATAVLPSRGRARASPGGSARDGGPHRPPPAGVRRLARRLPGPGSE